MTQKDTCNVISDASVKNAKIRYGDTPLVYGSNMWCVWVGVYHLFCKMNDFSIILRLIMGRGSVTDLTLQVTCIKVRGIHNASTWELVTFWKFHFPGKYCLQFAASQYGGIIFNLKGDSVMSFSSPSQTAPEQSRENLGCGTPPSGQRGLKMPTKVTPASATLHVFDTEISLYSPRYSWTAINLREKHTLESKEIDPDASDSIICRFRRNMTWQMAS